MKTRIKKIKRYNTLKSPSAWHEHLTSDKTSDILKLKNKINSIILHKLKNIQNSFKRKKHKNVLQI